MGIKINDNCKYTPGIKWPEYININIFFAIAAVFVVGTSVLSELES